MIDRDLVTRKIVLITTDLAALRALATKPKEEFLSSDVDELVAERLLERVIGRMIDINFHLLIESAKAPPRDYFESFTALASIGVLDARFATQIAAAAGLRNRIAYEYNDLDPGKVYDSLQWAVRDIPTYLERINAFIE